MASVVINIFICVCVYCFRCQCTYGTGEPGNNYDTITRTLTVESLTYVQSHRIIHHGDPTSAPAAGALIVGVGGIICRETCVPAM